MSQISLEVNSQERSLELRAQGQDGDFVSCIFPVPQLFDLRWHKLMLSVAGRVASVHVDCISASSQPLGPRQSIRPGGHVFLGLDAEQGKPVSVSTGSWFLLPHPREPWAPEGVSEPLPYLCGLTKLIQHSRPSTTRVLCLQHVPRISLLSLIHPSLMDHLPNLHICTFAHAYLHASFFICSAFPCIFIYRMGPV